MQELLKAATKGLKYFHERMKKGYILRQDRNGVVGFWEDEYLSVVGGPGIVAAVESTLWPPCLSTDVLCLHFIKQ